MAHPSGGSSRLVSPSGDVFAAGSTGERARGSLDQRVGLLAVALALEPDMDTDVTASELVRVADGNRTALLRALGRLNGTDEGARARPGPIGQRAAEALRLALSMLDEDRMAHGARS